MGQSPSSMRSKSGRQRSFRGFARRHKLNKSSLSHTFSLPPSEEYPELMNVNTATEEQLMTLPGVTRQLARAIVLHRQMIGRFKRVDDLALVSGIGAEKLELLRPEISISNRKQVSRASSCSQSLDSVRGSVESKLCSVNSSSVFQLQCVPGLNQEIAANIVDYRNKKGPFKSLDDLIKVRGMDVVRLSTVKQHLSLELRKCESLQYLTNGHLNGCADDTLPKSLLNGVTSTPKTPHRKSLSMPNKLPMILPNGFAAAPVNDILDLLSAYSHRPIVEEEFKYERDGIKCCRLASWNLHKLDVDKITNPGVREVICRTILENKLSLIAIQDVLDVTALKILCDELNSPSLRRVREWKSNSHRWEYCIADQLDSEKLGFLFDSSNKGITIEDIPLDQVCLLSEASEIRPLVSELATLRSERYITAPQAFLLSGRPTVILNVMCHNRLSTEDVDHIQRVVKMAGQCALPLALAGEFASWTNVQTLDSCEPLLDEGLSTTIDNKHTGQTCIVSPGTIDKSIFNGHSGAIKSGLSHLAIPRGWSWGGPASPYCPLWAEMKVPD
ncbi:endonuclease/exonuclease/phosphatase family domain-containing protein 1-like [Leguminivora glycinivorella]|uniref:endonuclease/exonuclease/phosphatase family domain-containing protein 1-like n=1 Tax=Leguminivora glycinivorella TaxID=1035111 RepID=UPI00200E243D|nr:endonuclease/exonuclease/phosphatase family domain-containing protein 1-like [Leguminivora glycinivorella]